MLTWLITDKGSKNNDVSNNNSHIIPLQVTDQELNFYMQQLSSAHTAEFDNLAALKELYIYVNKYYGDIVTTLDESPTARKLGLGHKLKSIALSVYPQHQNICWNSSVKNKQEMWLLMQILHENIIIYLITFFPLK